MMMSTRARFLRPQWFEKHPEIVALIFYIPITYLLLREIDLFEKHCSVSAQLWGIFILSLIFPIVFISYQNKKNTHRVQSQFELMEGFFSHIDQPMFIKDYDGRFLMASNHLAHLLGKHSKEELIGTTDHDHYPQTEADEMLGSLRSMLENQESPRIDEHTITLANGSQRIYQATKSILFSHRPIKERLVLGVGHDITETKNLQQQFKDQINLETTKRLEKELFLKTIYDVLPIGLLVLDEKGEMFSSNHAMSLITGYERKEIIGHSFTMLLPEEVWQSAKELYDKYIRQEICLIDPIWKIIRKNGQIATLHLHINHDAIIYWNNTPHAIISVTDISEEYEREQEKKKQMQFMVQQYKMTSLGEMITAICQQWRQPLASMTLTAGHIQHLAGNEPESKNIIQNSKNIIDDAKRLSEILDTFDTYCREADDGEGFDIPPVVLETTEILRPLLQIEGITLHLQHENFPSSLLKRSKSLFQQVLVNLVIELKNSTTSTHQRQLGDDMITIALLNHSDSLEIDIFCHHLGRSTCQCHQTSPYSARVFSAEHFGSFVSRHILEESFNGSFTADSEFTPFCFCITFPKEDI